MKLIFLGTGSAFTVGADNWQSNMLLEAPSGKKLLLDCGGDIRFSLAERGLTATDLDAVYISHLHGDHVGGLEWLGFSTFFTPHCDRPRLFASDAVLALLWDEVLQGGMRSISGKAATLDTYFDVNSIADEGPFVWEGETFALARVIHIDDSVREIPAYGLRFTLQGRKVFLTTDSQYSPDHLAPHFGWADMIFHDCETSLYPSGVHASYRDLRTLPAEIRAKTWLYHYQAGPLPDAVADGFLGFVVKGQVFS